jgi:peroxiredoxin
VTRPFILKTGFSAITVMLLTTLHHFYGAFIYQTPWRHHIAVSSLPAILVLVASSLFRLRSIANSQLKQSAKTRVTFIALLAGLIATGHASSAAGSPAVELFKAVGIQEVKNDRVSPTFTLPTIEGPALASTDLRGKIVLINFWATWCGPCKEEMPAMQRLHESLSDKDFALIAITTEQQRESILGFAKSLRLSFPFLLDPSKDVSAAFGVRGLPTTVIIDRSGNIVGRAVGPRRWDGPEAVALLKDLLQ